jgi:predicted amidohydrolase
MKTRLFFVLLLLNTVASIAAGDDKELVRNPQFTTAGGDGLPQAWSLWTPAWQQAACRVRAAEGGAVMDAPERPYAVGGLTQELRGVEPGKSYAVRAVARAENLASPLQSLLVRLEWSQAGKPLDAAGMLVRGPKATDGTLKFADVLTAPKQADGARLSLELKWPQGGSVQWEHVSVRETAPLPPRRVKIGTVYLKPNKSTPEQNLELFCGQVDAAGKLGLDIVCLPEAITVVGTGRTVSQVAEAIPGPSTRRLGDAARKNRLWVVAGLYERAGQQLFNTAVLLDRKGKLAGTYRKVHLPREEWKVGFSPGLEYPVFQTDFGTIAIQICYDYFFPETAAAFRLHGAEIVFAPTWGTTFADHDGHVEGENTFRVRARDEGLYLVPSVYDGNSMVIDPLGKVLASSQGRTGIFWHEVDLNKRECLDWVGHWRTIGPRDRMPSTYGPLVELAPAE